MGYLCTKIEVMMDPDMRRMFEDLNDALNQQQGVRGWDQLDQIDHLKALLDEKNQKINYLSGLLKVKDQANKELAAARDAAIEELRDASKRSFVRIR